MLVEVDDDGRDRSLEIDGNLIECNLITNNDIADDVGLEIRVIERHIKFLLSESVLASQVACLFDRERFDTLVLIVLDDRLQNVNATGVEP